MTAVTAELVKTLREMTGAGMMDCKKALTESAGDIQKAQDSLRKKGLKTAEKRSGKVAAEGIVLCYSHPGSRIGVIVELNCETDFVARNDEFQALARDIAMHIAWANPKYLSRDEVPEDVIKREESVFKAQIKPEQEKVADKILAGKLEKFYEEVCLLDQIDAKETSTKRTISGAIAELTGKMGEKVVLRRFARYELGDGIEKVQEDFASEVAQVANLQ